MPSQEKIKQCYRSSIAGQSKVLHKSTHACLLLLYMAYRLAEFYELIHIKTNHCTIHN